MTAIKIRKEWLEWKFGSIPSTKNNTIGQKCYMDKRGKKRQEKNESLFFPLNEGKKSVTKQKCVYQKELMRSREKCNIKSTR